MTTDVAPVPRAEHPRPQFVRTTWLNLNGTWQFEQDPSDTGLERGLLDRDLTDTILVPFAPESVLSGVGHVDVMAAVWYRREFAVPETWSGHRVLLHFGAVDHDATVWVDGAGRAEPQAPEHPGQLREAQHAARREHTPGRRLPHREHGHAPR